MNANNLLELICQEILGVINPLSEDCTIRLQIIDQLQAIIGTVESLRGATVEPFGSYLSHLFTRWGDLDISIELSNGSHILSPGRKHKLSLLGDVLKALKATGFPRLQLISHAKVPILKFTSHQSISCDISISNLSGQMKSKFLLWISVIDPRFRNMVLLVKEWAKAHNINNPKAGTLNSYSLCLLIIFHFQTCEPAIFPPLREIYPANMAEELRGVRSAVEQHFEEMCAANINNFRNTRRMINRSSLSELFSSFLEKFSDISIRAKAQGICTFTGMWEDIGTNMRWLPKTYALLIEDPLEQQENSARTVSSGQLIRISEAFRTSYELLTSPNQTRKSLIQSMVRPQVCRSLLPKSMETYPNTHFRPRPSPQHQGQFRKTTPRPVGPPNDASPRKPQPLPPKPGGRGKYNRRNGQPGVADGSNKRAPQASTESQGQAQQVWRPKNVTLTVL